MIKGQVLQRGDVVLWCTFIRHEMSRICDGDREQWTDLVGEAVNGLWGRPGDLPSRECNDLRGSRPAIPSGSKRCEFYLTRVEIQQKGLEPVTISAECGGNLRFALTSRTPCPGFSQSSPSQRVHRDCHRGSLGPEREPRPGHP